MSGSPCRPGAAAAPVAYGDGQEERQHTKRFPKHSRRGRMRFKGRGMGADPIGKPHFDPMCGATEAESSAVQPRFREVRGIRVVQADDGVLLANIGQGAKPDRARGLRPAERVVHGSLERLQTLPWIRQE